MTGALWLPAGAEARRQEMARTLDAEADETVLAAQVEVTRYWNPILKDIDQRLELVWVGGDPGEDLGRGLRGCRWHVRIRNAVGADVFMPVLAPDGGYRAMDSGVLEDLRERRMDAPGFFKREQRRRAERAAAVERKREAQRAEIREELEVRLKSKLAPSIRFGGSGWRARMGEPEVI